MSSLWTETVSIPGRERLQGDRNAEVAVIGGGMAGILTARLLAESGIDVVVLEAAEIGSGQTKNTTAKITSQHGLIYDKLAEQFGMEAAGQYASANEKAICEYRRIIDDYKIACHFTKSSAYLYTEEAAEGQAEKLTRKGEMAETLMREAETARALGILAEFTVETELPFPVAGAVRFQEQAHFHPLEFLKKIAEGLTIYEHTPALSVEEGRIRTERGTVTAEQVVFATHYPFINMPGYYFMRMYQERSYVLALDTGNLAGSLPFLPEGMYYGVDTEGLSLRSADGLLLLGGENHRTGENREGGRYRRLGRRARELWPGCEERFRWSAQDCMTLDGIPYIGKFSTKIPNWYVATGFQKWGMTGAMAAAMIIRDAIVGKENPDGKVFAPERFTPSASAKNFISGGLHTIRDLSREVFALPRAMTEELPCGHGGVVEYEGKKAGVYKEENGKLHVVSVRCPHLGCQLEWNPDEKSWDCPCHGSRFDYTGKRIDNPAQEGIK
ncbi:MAG: FAD-dependent oxidoreductase [Lachnospiraceae bacterium]|nr:FAD-dependent oxidoreductase [Lachnospiraceae bacterium]